MSTMRDQTPGAAVALVCVLSMAGWAFAQGEAGTISTQTGDSQIQIGESSIPSIFDDPQQPYSLFMWVYRTVDGDEYQSVLEIPQLLHIGFSGADDAVQIKWLGSTTHIVHLALQDATGNVPIDEWLLIGVTYDGKSTLTCSAQSETVDRVSDSVDDPAFTPNVPAGTMTIGRPLHESGQAQQGSYGLFVLREHAAGSADFQAIWTSRYYFSPYDMDNLDEGGTMNGADSVVWMANHAVLTAPLAYFGGTSSTSLMGGDLVIDNYCIYNVNAIGNSFRTVGALADVSMDGDAFVFSPPHAAGFFIREQPDVSIPSPNYVAGVSPKLRQIAYCEPDGLIRCHVSANSRGTQINDARNQTYPENYAHGFIQACLPQVAGVLNRPARTQDSERWFGFDCLSGPRRQGEVKQVSSSNVLRNFIRLWTGAPGNYGPGSGVFIADGSLYSMKCRPEPDSLMIAEAPLVVRAYLLRFPGAGAVTWRPENSQSQDAVGTLGEPTIVDLDTTTFTHVITLDDTVEARLDRLTLAGDFSVNIQPGNACYVGSNVGERSFSIVTDLEIVEGQTVLTFEYWFPLTPDTGSMLHFGPWGIEVIEHEFEALSPGNPEIFRGLELIAGGGSVVNYSWDAWRPGVDGFAFGTAGWSGHGYAPQISGGFADTIPQWLPYLETDVWLQCLAQQNSEPDSMADYLAEIRASLPDAEVAWLGDADSGFGTSESWHNYILDHAADYDVVAVSLLLDPFVGRWEEQVADGMRADRAHWSHRGNARLAERWSYFLRTVALPSPDINGDGEVGPADLAVILGSWGPCPPKGNCVADLNGDGQVDPADLAIILGSWDS